MNIDGKNLILGRLATVAAKEALLGEDVMVYNCDLVVITGRKKNIFEKYDRKITMGDPHHGPFFPKITRRVVRRTIRGMLPHKQARGREAYKRVKCVSSLPENVKAETIEKANVRKVHNVGYITVKELCEHLKK